MALPVEFLCQPLAHRGLHDLAHGLPENSPAAFQRAIDHGYGIELDVQLSADGQAMVFHDEDLDRLTEETGPITARTAAALGQIPLTAGQDNIPTLTEVLAQVNGQVPLLIEIKDQDGQLGPNTGLLECAVARDLAKYQGPVAVMSFNPHAVAAFTKAAPNIAVGLVTCDFTDKGWEAVPDDRRAQLTQLPDLARLNASFISHDRADLGSPVVARVKASGLPILCWTIRTPDQERAARKVADNITFEGYLA